MSWVISTKTKRIIKLINISFRPLVIEDMDALISIERMVYDNPWSIGKFKDSLENPNTLSSVITLGNQIIGYFVASQALDVSDLLNICIHPNKQHQGLGQQLFQNFIKQVKNQGVSQVFIEVRESNQSALLFYEKLGFERIDQRKKYYSNGENAKILRLKII